MANTSLLGAEVEDAVRKSLGRELGVHLTKQKLRLKSGGQFAFDAVSEDGRIVVSIKSSHGRTRGGKPPTGAIKAAVADLYYLQLVDADRRILVLTDESFHQRLIHDLRGRVAAGLEIRYVPLRPNLRSRVDAALDFASAEMMSRADEPE